MFWSTEDHHRQNYYTNLQSVQHQNGLQQATAAMPHQQQHLATQSNILQQQQQQQHQQQQQQQQHQQHRPSQQIQSHFANQQQFQHHQQWAAGRPGTILTVPPFIPQYTNNVPNSTQYCAPPPSYYQTQPQYPPQTSVSATPQQRCLPQGCTVFTMPPQAAALRQSVITQPPPNIMTPTTSATQQLQVQYFPTFCQPPLLGQQTYSHTRPRKHAIPIIHPETKENIMEKKFNTNDSSNADGTSSIATTPSSSSINDSKQSENDVKERGQEPISDEVPSKESNVEEIIEEVEEENTTEATTVAILDNVDSIEPEDVKVKDEDIVESQSQAPCDEELHEEADQTQSCTTTPNEPQTEEAKSSDDEDESAPTSHIEGNITSLSLLPPDEEKTPKTESTEPVQSTTSTSISTVDAGDEKVGKHNKIQQPSPSTTNLLPPASTKTTSKKTKRNSKRLKESQKKQKADLMRSENNNTNKATNQNESSKAKASSSDRFADPSNASTNRLKLKAKETAKSSSIKKETTSAEKEKSSATTTRENTPTTRSETSIASPNANDNSEESSLHVGSTETLNTYDENDHSLSSHFEESRQASYKSEEIASKILGIEPNDDNGLLFLNSSVSGYENDTSLSSPTRNSGDDEKFPDILFGDFTERESSRQELSPEESNNKIKSKEHEDNDKNRKRVASPEIKSSKEKKYSLDELKLLAKEPASILPPQFRGHICDVIGKNPRDPSISGLHQQNKFFSQMPYKDSINLNRRRNKQQQQMDYQQQQQQQQQGNRDMIRIYLPLKEEVKLSESENAWVPHTLKDFGPKSAEEDDEQILKKIRGILNKLTPENFDKLLQSASNFPMNTDERIKKVMLLIFEKTISEPNFAPTYARFCKFLFNADDSNHAMFQKILLARIVEEFDNNVNNAKAKEAKLKPLMEKLAAADPKDKLEIKEELDDQEYQFRRRAWGTVRFIGEMCKMGFITITKVFSCVESLLDAKCEEKLEFMCKLLMTVGPQLEFASQQQGYDKDRLDRIFVKIKQVIEKKNQGSGPKISSRVRFMMQDIVDLRSRMWDQKETTPLPLPSREVSPALSRGTPNQQHRRGARNLTNNSSGYDKKRPQHNDNPQKSTPIDASKLSFSNLEDGVPLRNQSKLLQNATSKPQLNQRQTFIANHQSRLSEQAVQPTPPKDLTNLQCEDLVDGLIETVREAESPSEWFTKWKSYDVSHQKRLINYVLTQYLHLVKCELNLLSKLFDSLFKEKIITNKIFKEAYEKFSETWGEILECDVPNGWTKIFKLLGPSLHLARIEIRDIWNERWFDTNCGERFLESMIVYFTSQFGATYMQNLWRFNSLQWNMFLREEKVDKYTDPKRFKFVEDPKCNPPIFVQRSTEELVERIKELLAQSTENIDEIIDFIGTNVRIDREFVRSLTMLLCDYSVIYIPNNKNNSNSTKKPKAPDHSTTSSCSSLKFRTEIFNKICKTLLRFCIDSNDEHELTCLNAILAELNRIKCDKFPVELLNSILVELYGEIISKESFEKWQKQLSNVEGGLSKDLEACFRTLQQNYKGTIKQI